jgi:hypothetical protein
MGYGLMIVSLIAPQTNTESIETTAQPIANSQ